jgi:hypothetical protein
MMKEIPDSIELEQALRHAAVTFHPDSISFDKRTGSAKVRVNGAYTADGLRALAAEMDYLAAAIEVVTR